MEIFIIIGGIIAVILIVFLIIRLEKTTIQPWQKQTREKLEKINQRFDDQNIHTLKSCLIDADTLLDHCFKERGINGNTMSDRLKQAGKFFSRTLYNDIWTAHKTRNKLVHEVEFTISPKELVEDYRTLKRAISEIIKN